MKKLMKIIGTTLGVCVVGLLFFRLIYTWDQKDPDFKSTVYIYALWKVRGNDPALLGAYSNPLYEFIWSKTSKTRQYRSFLNEVGLPEKTSPFLPGWYEVSQGEASYDSGICIIKKH